MKNKKLIQLYFSIVAWIICVLSGIWLQANLFGSNNQILFIISFITAPSLLLLLSIHLISIFKEIGKLSDGYYERLEEDLKQAKLAEEKKLAAEKIIQKEEKVNESK